MSNEIPKKTEESETTVLWKAIISVLITMLIIGGIIFGAIFALTPAGQITGNWLSWFFGLNSVQLWWYVTRASGLVAYMLLWFSMVLGLAVSSKYLDHLLDRVFTYDFHQFISLLSIAFIMVHVIVLLLDRYLPYNIWQVIIPFISPYRPLWVGVGVLAFYLIILVSITFYIRRQIGMKTFRVIHVLSLLGYLGATLHGIYSGTDSPLPVVGLLYDVTGLAVLFLTVFWVVMVWLRRIERRNKEKADIRLATAQRNVVNR